MSVLVIAHNWGCNPCSGQIDELFLCSFCPRKSLWPSCSLFAKHRINIAHCQRDPKEFAFESRWTPLWKILCVVLHFFSESVLGLMCNSRLPATLVCDQVGLSNTAVSATASYEQTNHLNMWYRCNWHNSVSMKTLGSWFTMAGRPSANPVNMRGSAQEAW